MIAPYMGWNHGGDFKGPWDSVANKHVRSGWAAGFLGLRSSRSPFNTIVYGVAGPDTAFEPSDYPYVSKHTYDDLPANLVLVMEVADSKTHWMQPGDYDVTKLLAATGRLGDTVKGLMNDRIHLLFADGEVWALSPDTPIDAVKPFFTITGAKAASREESLSKYRVD